MKFRTLPGCAIKPQVRTDITLPARRGAERRFGWENLLVMPIGGRQSELNAAIWQIVHDGSTKEEFSCELRAE